jgi:hypothetical protein
MPDSDSGLEKEGATAFAVKGASCANTAHQPDGDTGEEQ